jgi:hypothetical protein
MAKTCPNCGERLLSMRKVPIIIGTVGLLALAVLAVFLMIAIRDRDLYGPRSAEPQNAPATSDVPPSR